MLRAALYIRVSTDEQTEYSPAAQQKALKEYAAKNGMETLPQFIFVDEGKSGRSIKKRSEFQRMIGIAKQIPKPFDVILVHRFDRFARNREDSIVFKSMLRNECHIRVISVTESFDEEDKLSGLIEALLEAMAEYYSINLAEEVKKGMSERARQGGFQSSPPLGYRMGPGKVLQIVPGEAEYIRFIFSRFACGAGKSQIVRQLEQMGAKSKRGNPIDIRNVDYILQNPVYTGQVRWTPTKPARRNFSHPDTIVIGGGHEPIINYDLFHKAAKRIESEKKGGSPGKRPPGECSHWLSGLLRCSNCGATLTATGMRNPSPSFQCRGYSNAVCHISHSISIKKAERAVLDELIQALEPCEKNIFFLNGESADDLSYGASIARKRFNQLDRRLARAKEAYLSGADTLDDYQKNKAQIERDRNELTGQTYKIQDSHAAVISANNSFDIKTLADILQSGCEMRIKATAIRAVIEKIVFNKNNSNLEVYYRDT